MWHLIKNQNYCKLWETSYVNELVQLAQWMSGWEEGTNTIMFIKKEDIPTACWWDVTYGIVLFSYRPENKDPNRTRLTVGGDRVHYPGDCRTPTVDLPTEKMLQNSVISTPGYRYMTFDIKYFYLNKHMKRSEYIRLKLSDLPTDFIQHYKLTSKTTTDLYVYIKIYKGMYGLPQSGILAQKLLEQLLKGWGYRHSSLTPRYWKHDWWPIYLNLFVDNFGVNYAREQHSKHLVASLSEHYTISWDWECKRYLGMTLDCYYEKHEV